MKAPITEIILSGETYSIEAVAGGSLRDCEGEAWADMDKGLQIIRIQEGVTPRAFLKFLGHEVMHDALHRAGLQELVGNKVEEALCWAIGATLIEIIRDNPALVRAVQEAYGTAQD